MIPGCAFMCIFLGLHVHVRDVFFQGTCKKAVELLMEVHLKKHEDVGRKNTHTHTERESTSIYAATTTHTLCQLWRDC